MGGQGGLQNMRFGGMGGHGMGGGRGGMGGGHFGMSNLQGGGMGGMGGHGGMGRSGFGGMGGRLELMNLNAPSHPAMQEQDFKSGFGKFLEKAGSIAKDAYKMGKPLVDAGKDVWKQVDNKSYQESKKYWRTPGNAFRDAVNGG